MIYLMSPYSDPEPEVREFRYEMAKAAALVLYLRGLGVYSPIVNSHPLADTYGLDRGHDFWWFQNKEMMELSDGAILLTLPGWAISKGVRDEISYYSTLGKQLNFLEPTEMVQELMHADFAIPLIIASRYLQPSPELSPESDR